MLSDRMAPVAQLVEQAGAALEGSTRLSWRVEHGCWRSFSGTGPDGSEAGDRTEA
jgi:hypothetical protein